MKNWQCYFFFSPSLSNGDLDPWSGGGVTKDITDTLVAITIPDGAHHLDLRANNAFDPKTVLLARSLEVKYMKQWIRDFYASLRGKHWAILDHFQFLLLCSVHPHSHSPCFSTHNYFPLCIIRFGGAKVELDRRGWWWQQPSHTQALAIFVPLPGSVSSWELSRTISGLLTSRVPDCLSQEGESIPLFLCRQGFLLVLKLKSFWPISHSSPLPSQKEKQKT